VTPDQKPIAPAKLGCAGRLGVVLLVAAMAWIAIELAGHADRASRTETIEGFGAAGPIHLAADGRIIVARSGTTAAAADGSIEAFDPVSRSQATLLADLPRPVAADIAPDGTVCAVSAPDQPGDPASLRCSSRVAIDLADLTLAGFLDDLGLQVSRPADIISDRASGWVVADAGRAAILHVDDAGTVTLMATYKHATTLASRPVGLAMDDESVLVALQRGGYSRLDVTDRDKEITESTWVGGGDAVAIVARARQPLILVSDRDGGLVTYEVGVDADRPRVVDGLPFPRGIVLLPDGRLAVADGSRLVIVRPSRPLP
jgi:hypothetical protein